jgi:uncharacterized membrane protein YvbJ|tara:strand:- start:8873 stop:9106 length:234 start_codon:yes stop_codon:yes gene_type:complete
MADETIETIKPRWDVVNTMFNKMDGVLDECIKEKSMNFLEVGIVMLMVNEKLTQEKTNIYLQYLRDESDKAKSDIYH